MNGEHVKVIEEPEAENRKLREALEDIKFWCETTTCEICGIKEMV